MTEFGTVVVPDELAGLRADRVLSMLAGLSRAASRRLLDDESVLSDGSPVARATALPAGAVLTYPLPAETTPLAAEQISFDAVMETADVIVVDKPAGLVVHPGAGHRRGTLVNGLVGRYPDLAELGEQHRWGLVHRLDRDTSGLLLVARKPEVHTFLQAEMKARRISRTYTALLTGRLEAATGTIDAPVGRDPIRPTRMAVIRDGKAARTHYRRMAEWPDATLVSVDLETGRTHQIRVHFSSIGNSVVGDPTYGRAVPDLGRTWLHATRLRFSLPDQTPFDIASPIPAELHSYLADLGTPLTGSVEL